MGKLFLVFGAVVSLMFSYASYTGFSAWDYMSTGRWGPAGHTERSSGGGGWSWGSGGSGGGGFSHK